MLQARRNVIYLEDAAVLTQEPRGSGQYVLRLRAPRMASSAQPGMFAHVRCGEALPMRRPMSIMSADASAGAVEFLYKVVGEGTRRLATHCPGDILSTLGPIGRPFAPDPQRSRPLLLGGGVGIPPIVFLAERLRREPRHRPFAVMGSEVPFPLATAPSRIDVLGMPAGVDASLTLLERWGIASRLASLQGYPGCFPGYLTELARRWLEALPSAERAEVAVYACGPTPMLAASARLAEEFDLPCQVSLEEFMACAVGGCAGCTVRVHTGQGHAMQRVCVDGPVFDATAVVWR